MSQASNSEVADIPVNAANNEGGLAVAVDSDAHRLYVSQAHQYRLSVINTENGQLVADIDLGADGWVNGIAVDEERGKIWASSGATGKVLVIDQATNTIENRIQLGYSMWGVGINPEQDLVFVADQGNNLANPAIPGSVYILNLNTQEVMATVPIGGTAHQIAVDVSEDKVYVSNISSNRVIEVARSQIVLERNVSTRHVRTVEPSAASLS